MKSENSSWPSLATAKTLSFVLGMSLAAFATRAAMLTVTNTSDYGAGSLRQSIQGAAPGDTINFAITGTITLTNGELLLTNNLGIIGPGATNLAISGNQASRVFEIGSNITVSISGLAVRNGHASDGTNSSDASSAGGNGSD